MNKFNKLYDEIIEMLYWAEEQRHINFEQRDLIIENIDKIKNGIEGESTTEEQNNV